MGEHLFSFIKSEDEELAVLGEHIEKRLYSDTQSVISKSRIFVERIINMTFEKEELNVQMYPTLIDRIHKLDRAGILTDYVIERLHWLRKAGNKASHDAEIPKVEDAVKAHRFLFDIAVWFMEIYDYTFEAPEYHLPYQNEQSIDPNQINQLVNQTIKETIGHAVEEKLSHLQSQQQNEKHSAPKLEDNQPKPEPVQSDEEGFKPLAYFRNKGYEVVDKRSKGGTVWVIGEWEDRNDFFDLRKHKFYFRFSKKGSRSTQNRPAWFMLNKSYKGELDNEASSSQHVVTPTGKNSDENQQPHQSHQKQEQELEEKVEQNQDIVLLKINAPLEQVSDQVAVPKHLLNIEINKVLNGRLSDVTNMLGLYKFNEINDDQLRKLFIKHQDTFFSMVTILWMLGVRFSGKLGQLVKLSEQHPTTFIQVNSDLESQLSHKLNRYIADKFKNVGIEKVSDLNMIPVQSIEWLLEQHSAEFNEKMLKSLPIKELSISEGRSGDTSEGSDAKTITLGNKLLTIPSDLADVKLKIDQFENCQNVVRKLNEVGIYKINELPNKLDGFHTRLKHVGPKAIEKFWEGLVLLVNGDIEEVEIKKASDEFQGEKVVFENEELTFCETMRHQLIDSDAGYFNSMPIVLKKFKEVGFYYYKDLPYNLSKVQEIKGVGLNKVKQLFQILKEINDKYIEEEKFEEEIKGLDDQQLIHFFLNKAKEEITQVINNPNKQKQLSLHQLSLKIFEERFRGFHSGESVTLQSLGDKYGVTRERVRQIAGKTLDKLGNLESRWVEKIVEQAKNKQYLTNDYFNLDEFVDFILVQILESHDLNYKPELNCFTIHSDTEFNELNKQASREINHEFKGRLTTKSEIDDFIADFASRHQIGEELVQMLFNGYFIHVESLDGYILSNTNKHDAAQIVLSQYPDGLDVYKDIDRIADELNKVLPGEFKADRSTSTLFLTSKDCYLWGRGRYIHKNYVNFDAPILDDILKQTEEIVNERGILSVNRLYKDHEEQLKALNIPNEYALYTLLRTKESDELSFIKFPKIYPAGSDRKENSEIIKDYIRKLGKPIPVKDLKKHFMKELGWKKFTIEFAISNDYEIFSCDWGIITVAELDPAVNQDKLKTIHDKIARNLKEQDVVHINKFYVDYESLCRSMNIDNALYLYNALRYYFHEELLYFRYPYITEFGREFDEMTNVKLIESYVLEEMAEVSREEVADWVINELGGNDGTVHNVLSSSNNLLTYTRGKFGELIHRDVIGWNDEKEKQLIQVIQDYTEQFKDDFEKPFINLDKALDDIESQLPELDNDVLWTSDLIADILKRSTQHSFLIIGSSDKIVINQSLFNQIGSHTQFIEYMLLKHFNGSAKLSDFRNMLHDIGYSSKGILHEVEVDIKKGQTPLTIVGNEIVYDESKVNL